MECKFSTGDAVLVNDTAIVASGHMGDVAVVVDTILSEEECLATIQFDDETILDNVPESELSPI